MKVVDFQSTIKWYDQNAAQYSSSVNSLLSKEFADKFIQLLGKRNDILDAGCGAGRDSGHFNSLGLSVTGIDLSEGLIKEARKKYPKVTFIIGDLRNLPLDKNSFDGVWAHASLVHMQNSEDTARAINEFHRVLRNDGILFVLVKTSDKETAVVSDDLSKHERFFRYYTKDQIENLVIQAGFRLIESKYCDDSAGREEVKWIALFAQKIGLR